MASTGNKIGIFGGTFNPVHNGHVKGLVQVGEAMKLDEMRVIPNWQNPFKLQVDDPGPSVRSARAGSARSSPRARTTRRDRVRAGG